MSRVEKYVPNAHVESAEKNHIEASANALHMQAYGLHRFCDPGVLCSKSPAGPALLQE